MLDVVGPKENLQTVRVEFEEEVALRQGGKDERVVYFSLLDFGQLAVLFEGYGQVVYGLFVALVQPVGLTEVIVSSYQPELRLPVYEHQDLTDCLDVHPYPQQVFST